MRSRTLIALAAGCLFVTSCDPAATLVAKITLPNKLDYRRISIDQGGLQSVINLERPGIAFQRQSNWRIDGDIASWDRGFLCGGLDGSAVPCSSVEPRHIQLDKLSTSYMGKDIQTIQFYSDGKIIEYYYGAVPGRVRSPTRAMILAIARLTAKKYKRPSFEICTGDEGSQCHEELVGN